MSENYQPKAPALLRTLDDARRWVFEELARIAVAVNGLVERPFGVMYTKDGATAQTGITTTPVKLTGWATAGQSRNLTVSIGADEFVAKAGGRYEVTAQISFSGTASTTFQFHIRVNGAETAYQAVRKVNSGGDTGSVSIVPGIITLARGDAVSVYVESSAGGGASLTLEAGQFYIVEV